MAKRSSLLGKLVSVMCAVSLCSAFSFPCEALGKSGEVGAESAGAGSVSSTPDVEQQLETSDGEAELTESAESEVGSSLSGLLDASSTQTIDLYTADGFSAASDNSLFEASIEAARNTTHAQLVVPLASDLLSQGIADSVSVRATMTYGGKTTRTVEQSAPLKDFINGAYDIDFGTYGKFNASVTFLRGSETINAVNNIEVGIIADEYNIAPVSATLPVTFFSLNLWGDDSIRNSGPVILMMERPGAYNWDNLPGATDDAYGVYGIPYLTQEEVSYQPADFDAASALFRQHISVMADYVHDLYGLNPDSRFNLYCVDFYCGMVNSVIYANKIPSSQYSLTVMSDGAFTYNRFASVYDSSNPASQHENLIAQWAAMKEATYSTGVADSSTMNWNNSNKYLWAIVDSEPNAQLWVARKDLIKTPDNDNAFGLQIQSNPKVVQVNIGNLLKQNIQPSESNTAEFKALYNFNDSYFSDAEEQGKKVMLFLGTRVTSETAFSDYARFAMSYFGDDYLYYYKGHPGTPTDMYPAKQEQLQQLGITDVDSSVAAELILFFNPEIYLSGYGSSTYASVPDGMAKGMFQMTKEQGLANPMYMNMEYWASQVTDGSSQTIRDLVKQGHDNYLVEFSDAICIEKGFDIATWDATDAIISYYKANEAGGYDLVSKSQGIAAGSAISEGDYLIKSALNNDAVLDVSAASMDNGANVQLYEYNGTAAQKWRVSVGSDGYATISNIGSGKVLDVANGSAYSGSNVWQYDSNDTVAQKWQVLSNGDGTFKVVSALADSLVLDAAGASCSNGTNIQLWSDNGTAAQAFEFIPLQPEFDSSKSADLEDGYYEIRSGVNTAYALDIRDWSTDDGTPLQVWSVTGNQNQVFKITKLDSGFYRIESAWSGKSIDADSGRMVPGGKIQQWESFNGSKNQEWFISEQSGGGCLLRNAATGLALDLMGAAAIDGQAVHAYTSNGTLAQSWLFVPVENPQLTIEDMADTYRDVVPDGSYVINSRAGAGLSLDVVGASQSDGANVQLHNTNFTDAQLWRVSHDEKGFVTFTNAASGKALDVSGGVLANESNVQQYESNGTSAQKWVVVRMSDGEFKIVSALSRSYCLDIQGGNTASGANVDLHEGNGEATQLFELYSKIA